MQINIKFDSMEEFLKYVVLDGSVKTTFTTNAPKEKAPADSKAQEPTAEPVVTAFDKAVADAKALAEDPAPFAEEPKSEPAKKVSMTDVRAVALKLSKSGKSGELREALSKFGAAKLSDVKAEDYGALLEALGEING